MIDRDEFCRLCKALPDLSWQQSQRDKKFWDEKLRSAFTPEQWRKFGEGPMSEQVLVFPASALEPFADKFIDRVIIGRQQVDAVVKKLLAPGATHYMDRAAAEVDPNFKQVIPYCVLTQGKSFFIYQRTKKGGESRLHDKWSLGVGGHINPCDGEECDELSYIRAVARELFEEVGLLFKDWHSFMNIVGLIFDPSNDVGKVHFGMVHKVEVPTEAKFTFKDPALANGRWVTKAEVCQEHLEFENWSGLVVEYML